MSVDKSTDVDPEETAEWVESFEGLVKAHGEDRARQILDVLNERAGASVSTANSPLVTDYINTIPVAEEPEFAGNEEIERRYRSLIRWNAAVLVHRAQRADIGVGGHISTYAGAATLYEVGLNHFFRGPDHPSGGDQVFFQGHASPGHVRPGLPRGSAHRGGPRTASGRRSRRHRTGSPPTRTRG